MKGTENKVSENEQNGLVKMNSTNFFKFGTAIIWIVAILTTLWVLLTYL